MAGAGSKGTGLLSEGVDAFLVAGKANMAASSK
jgi:hypothetical protein